MKAIHAPSPKGWASLTMCNSIAEKPLIGTPAKASDPGWAVTCFACLSKLKAHPQWANQLIGLGYTMANRKRKAASRKGDPRQADFADLFGGKK